MGLDVDSDQKKNPKRDRQTVSPDLCKLFNFFLVSSFSLFLFISLPRILRE